MLVTNTFGKCFIFWKLTLNKPDYSVLIKTLYQPHIRDDKKKNSRKAVLHSKWKEKKQTKTIRLPGQWPFYTIGENTRTTLVWYWGGIWK